MDIEKEDTILLFGPKNGKSLKKSYPEIAAQKEFKDLTNEDLLFSWYVGNPSSPIDPNLDIMFRNSSAAAICFTKDSAKKLNYSKGEYPDEVKIAIEKMSKYSPEVRMASKRMIQAMFQSFQKMVSARPEEFVIIDKDGNKIPDWTAKKQYIDSCTKISEALPGLIKQIEEGFGIEEKKNTSEGTKAIDKFHQDK